MQPLISKDGTPIAYTTIGSGPHIILVDGAFCHRNFGPNKALANLLKDNFTVTTYDRRGRGESGNTLPYSVEREIEDLGAVINHLGGPVMIYGISSGAALALEAANAGLPVSKLALYEIPYIVDTTRAPLTQEYVDTMVSLVNSGEMGKTVTHFMRNGVGLPAFVIILMKLMPAWKKLKQLAPTAVYDTLILGDKASGKPLTKSNWPHVQIPVLAISGTKSEKWAQNAMKKVADVLPYATHHDLTGQTHMVKPAVLAPELMNFFKA